jgi:predicted PurR-regulated permease PerM
VTQRAIEITIGLRTLVLGALFVALVVAVASIKETLVFVFLSVFLALVFELPVRLLMQRTGWTRGKAAALAILGIVIAGGALLVVFLVPLVGSLRDFLHDLPDLVTQLRESDELSFLGDSGAAENAQDGANQLAEAVPNAISAILGVAGDTFSVLLGVSTLFFLTLFLMIDMPRLLSGIGSVLMPDDADRWLPVWERITRTVSRWALGALAIAIIAGTIQGGTAWLLGSSHWLALGLIAGLLDLIPMVGATIAGFILVPTLLAEEGLTAAIIMLVVILVYQQLENNILTPTIQGKATDISAFIVIFGVTIGSALLGVLGALVAVPVAASIQIVVQEVAKARQAKVEAAYAADPARRPIWASDEAAEAGP